MVGLQKITTKPAIEMVGVTDNRAQCDELRSNPALTRTYEVGEQQFDHHTATWLSDELRLIEHH